MKDNSFKENGTEEVKLSFQIPQFNRVSGYKTQNNDLIT